MLNILQNDIKHIAVKREPGSKGAAQVQQYIISRIDYKYWYVEEDMFTENKVDFCNIIASVNPEAPKLLVLAAHYDSKKILDPNFVGAIDAASSCAILLQLADLIPKIKLPTTWGVKLVFFDGEEALGEWSKTDSLYGSRHLAAQWKRETVLNRIKLLVLLDLLGTTDTTIPNYFHQTQREFDVLINIQKKLSLKPEMVIPFTSSAVIEDDHIPFLRQGVKVLHLIPFPFPPQWHKATDDIGHLNFDIISNWVKLLQQFVVSYCK